MLQIGAAVLSNAKHERSNQVSSNDRMRAKATTPEAKMTDDTTKQTQPDRVVIIAGAPRTGTHLANALLCKCADVQPLLTEASAFFSVIDRSRAAMVRNLRSFEGNYFDSDDELDNLNARMLDCITSHMYARYPNNTAVMRGPMITKFQDVMIHVTPKCIPVYRICMMVRDPRDILCSIKTWSDKRKRRTGSAIATNLVDYLVTTVEEHYAIIRGTTLPANTLKTWRYEDVVRQPDSFTAAIADWLGISLEPHEDVAVWDNKKADLSHENASVGDAITPLYNSAVSEESIGRYRSELSKREIRAVERRLDWFMQRFGYT